MSAMEVRPASDRRMPPIGLVLRRDQRRADPKTRRWLSALSPGFLRVDVAPGDDAPERLAEAVGEARLIGAALEVALLVDRVEHARGLAAAAAEVRPARVLVLPRTSPTTTRELADAVREVIRGTGLSSPVGGGTDRFFADLNRDRPPLDALDLVCYSISPQVHVTDDLSVMETLEVQGLTVETARSFASCPIHVGPLSLRMRYNPDAVEPYETDAGAVLAGVLPASVDQRQMSLFAAAWTLGAVIELASAGADAITLYETTGWRGVIETTAGSPPPFRSRPGSVFPAYHVIGDLCALRDAPLRPIGGCPPHVRAIAADVAERTVVLITNCGPEAVTVPIAAPGSATWRVLDLGSARRAMTDPEGFRVACSSHLAGASFDLTLGAFATARVELNPAAGPQQSEDASYRPSRPSCAHLG
jgi:hypothetical protein